MTPRILAAAVACALVSLWATPAHAGGCGTVTTLELGVETIYIDDRSAESGNPEDIWIYIETNHVPGLQTGGKTPLLPEDETVISTTQWLIFGWDPCYSGAQYGPDMRLRYSIL